MSQSDIISINLYLARNWIFNSGKRVMKKEPLYTVGALRTSILLAESQLKSAIADDRKFDINVNRLALRQAKRNLRCLTGKTSKPRQHENAHSKRTN